MDDQFTTKEVEHGPKNQISVIYKQKGLIHREDGPACLTTYDDSKPQCEVWMQHGKYHRVGGPAHQVFDQKGVALLTQYFQHDRLHNDAGPALIERDASNRVIKQEFWIQGQQVNAQAACRQQLQHQNKELKHHIEQTQDSQQRLKQSITAGLGLVRQLNANHPPGVSHEKPKPH